MAQAIAESLVQRLGLTDHSVVVDSAGVSAGEGYSASREAVLAMNNRGINLSDHQSKQLTTELVDQAQVIYTMTPSHAQAVLQIAPGSEYKVFPLDTLHPIADPIGGPLEVYCAVADQLERLIQARLEEIVT